MQLFERRRFTYEEERLYVIKTIRDFGVLGAAVVGEGAERPEGIAGAAARRARRRLPVGDGLQREALLPPARRSRQRQVDGTHPRPSQLAPAKNRRDSMRLPHLLIGLAALLTTAASAQTLPPGVTKEQAFERLATDNLLFLKVATKALHWEEPAEPVPIAGPLYFVGTRGLGAFLFATSEGHVLMNTGLPSSGPMIEASIRKLGLKPEDIHYLINGHAHIDHVGAFAYMKKLAPGAVVAVMDQEVSKMQSGGRGDFKYADDFAYEGVKADRVLRTGDTIRIGDVLLQGFLTPGHTQGSTTWIATIVVDGKPLVVAFPDGAGFNPGYRLHKDPIYPGIEEDLRRTHYMLEMLKPDIWLAPHNEYYDFEGKRERAKTQGLSAWMDPEGYRRWFAGKKRAFEDQVDLETKVPPKP